VRAVGAAVEALGFDHLLAYDHVLGAAHDGRQPTLTGPYDETDPFHDPFVMFSYLAGRHEALEFVTGVLILPQRQTVLVARQAADLSLLSGGRLRLGVGVGWNPVEYEALGQDFSTRGVRQAEQIPLLRRLWSGEVVEVDGRFDRIDRAALVPRPTRPPEIWLGGFSDAAFRRAARLGDGFLFGGRRDEVSGQWNRVRELLAEEGRPVEGFGSEYAILSNKGPADVAAKIEQWQQWGGTHATVVTMGLGLDSTEAHIDYLGRTAAALDLRPR
jgi:probable F420-dependent oxidoreductase